MVKWKKKKAEEPYSVLDKLGMAWTVYNGFFCVLGVVLFFIGLFAWGYLLTARDAQIRRILIAESVVIILTLLGSIVRILYFRYEENILRHVQLTVAASGVMAVIGYYIAGIHILAAAAAPEAEVFYSMMEFFVFLGVAVILNFIPSLMIAVLMWIFVRIFGKPTEQ
ncbi:MAG: hypothetical protein Q4F83_01865 [Eubacteriales bacterium]|nr:hypothetical protein [Eubacteriales bacterium]